MVKTDWFLLFSRQDSDCSLLPQEKKKLKVKVDAAPHCVLLETPLLGITIDSNCLA